MTVLTRVNQISKTIKNMGRFRHIVAVFAKHGFAELLERSHLGGFIPTKFRFKPDPEKGPTTYERLRAAFEELGPTFIKLGQVLATRGDILPPELIIEMKKLQDNVPPFDFKDVQDTLRNEFKRPLEELFQEIRSEPLAAASIAQVHEAVSLTGEEIVLKIRRPNIAKEVRIDIDILNFIASWLEETIPEIRIFSPRSVIAEFGRSLKEELDFNIEANNLRRIRHNLREFKSVRVPVVYGDLSTAKVLTMERFRGVRIDDVDSMRRKGIDPKEVLEKGMDAFLHMVLADGLFHCDLHAGNVMVLDDGTIGLIDFGVVGRLSQRVRDHIIHLFIALFTENYENLAYSYLELAPSRSAHIDIEAFQKDLMDTLSPIYGMNIKELDVGKVLMDSTGVAARHQLELPRDLILLFRALVTAQGMCRELHPEFDIVEAASKHLKTVINLRYSKDRLMSDFMLLARDSFDLIQSLPRQLRFFIRKLHHNQVGFQHQFPQLKSVTQMASRHFLYKTYLFTGCFFLFIGQIKLDSSIPPLFFGLSLFVWIPWVISLGFFFLAFRMWILLR